MGYNIFDPSSQKKFIKRSVQFEEEPMQKIELDQGECLNPPLHDDVSNDYSSNFSDSDMDDDYYDIHSYHDSPLHQSGMRKPYKQLVILLEIH